MTFFVIAIFLILAINLISLDVFSFEEDKVTKIHYAGNISPTHEKLIKMFNEQYKGEIKVVPIDLPFTKYSTNEIKELLVKSLRGKSKEIDILAIDRIWTARFSKWTEPLDAYFSQEERNKILKPVYQASKYNGKLASLPMYFDIGILCYRTDLIKQLDRKSNLESTLKNSITWRRFIQLGKKWSQISGSSSYYLLAGENFEGLICNYLEILYSKGGEYCPKNGNNLLQKDKIKSLKFLKNLIYKYNITPTKITGFTEVDVYRYALENDIPFFRAWFSNLKDTTLFGEYSYKLDSVKFAPLPHFQKYSQARYVYGGWNLVVSKFSRHKKESVKFLKFLMSRKAQKLMFKESYYLPVIKSLYQDSTIVKNSTYKLLEGIINKYGFSRPKYKNYTRISNVVSHYINQALENKELSPQKALELAKQSLRSGEIILE